MSQSLAYQIGGIFVVAAALMILSMMRDRIPAELRKAARWATGALVVAIAGMAAYRAMPSVQLPSFGTHATPATTRMIREPLPMGDSPKSWKPKPKDGESKPTIREISPQEAEQLMEEIRSRQAIPIGR